MAVVLVLCHGAFGYAHQISRTDNPGPPAVHAAGPGENHPTHHDTDNGHSAVTYFATLLAVFFLVLLPPRGGRTRVGAYVRTLFGRRPSTEAYHPPRGPTLQTLQVFRL